MQHRLAPDRLRLALDYLGMKGMLPVNVWGVPPADPELSELAEKWKAAISTLETNPDASLPE